MSRWEPDAQGRLRQAALELFAERGFEQTTVAEIAARAGLTERTFFRHFADKREVLFAGSEVLQELFVTAIAEAPPDATALDAVRAALLACGGFFTERQGTRVRQAVIDANPELQERELIKLARLSTAVGAALARRGVGEPAASLAGQAAIGVFHVAFGRWVAGGETRSFAELVEESLGELRLVMAQASVS